MSQLGLGVMLNQLGGNKESAELFGAAIGKTVEQVEHNDDTLYLAFTDGTGVKLSDEGQSCCENRYMRTDDELSDFVGAELRGSEVREAPSVECKCDEHDVAFLVIQTSAGNLTMSNHNEHNGYYGGFWIVASKWSPA